MNKNTPKGGSPCQFAYVAYDTIHYMEYNNLEKILPTFFLVINSFVLSLYILPVVKRVGGKSEKLFDGIHRIGQRPIDRTSSIKNAASINELFDEYIIEYKSIETLVENLKTLTRITFLGTILLYTLDIFLGNFEESNWGVLFKEITTLLIIFAVFYKAIEGIATYLPGPETFQKFDFLTNRLGYHPRNLMQDIAMSVNYIPGETGTLEAAILTNFKIHGYKYVLCITKENKIIFSTCGKVKLNDLKETWLKGEEYEYRASRVSIGNFGKPSKDEEESFKTHLFIFDPCTIGEKCTPFYGQGSLKLSSHTLSTTGHTIDAQTFSELEYTGEKLNIRKIKWTGIGENDNKKMFKDFFQNHELKIKKVKARSKKIVVTDPLKISWTIKIKRMLHNLFLHMTHRRR